MGEKDETKKEGDISAAAGGGDLKAVEFAGVITVVLKLDLHCEGCAKKVRRSISHLEGVERVKADCDAKKLTVTGNVDPTWLRETVENKTKKKVELISPQPKKDVGGGGAPAAGGGKNAEEKSEKKTEESTKKPKEAVISTVVMKTKLHCDGCANKIKRIIDKNIDGVTSVTTDFRNDLITVIGTMDVKEIVTYLREKLRREVGIVPPKKNDDGGEKKKEEGCAGGGGGEKKEKEKEKKDGGGGSGGEGKEKEGGSSSGGGGERKENEGGDGEKKDSGVKKEDKLKYDGSSSGERSKGGGDGGKVEVNKMEHHGYNPQTYYAVAPTYDQTYANEDYGMALYPHDHRHHHHQGYSSYSDYAVQYTNGPSPPPPPPPTYLSTNDGMFSDENPNGCFVM